MGVGYASLITQYWVLKNISALIWWILCLGINVICSLYERENITMIMVLIYQYQCFRVFILFYFILFTFFCLTSSNSTYDFLFIIFFVTNEIILILQNVCILFMNRHSFCLQELICLSTSSVFLLYKHFIWLQSWFVFCLR